MALYLGHFDFSRPLLWVAPGVLTAAECGDIVRGLSGATWLAATVNGQGGREVNAQLRNNSTAVLRGSAWGAELWKRVLPHVPATMSREDERSGDRVSLTPCGVFEPLRVYRYEVGQHFGLHQDQSYFRDDGARSLLTLLVYLNDDFEGGETEFPEQDRVIAPRTGDLLLFQHMLLHAGRAVTRGTKFVLRTDVLFSPAAVAPPGPLS